MKEYINVNDKVEFTIRKGFSVRKVIAEVKDIYEDILAVKEASGSIHLVKRQNVKKIIEFDDNTPNGNSGFSPRVEIEEITFSEDNKDDNTSTKITFTKPTKKPTLHKKVSEYSDTASFVYDRLITPTYNHRV